MIDLSTNSWSVAVTNPNNLDPIQSASQIQAKKVCLIFLAVDQIHTEWNWAEESTNQSENQLCDFSPTTCMEDLLFDLRVVV